MKIVVVISFLCQTSDYKATITAVRVFDDREINGKFVIRLVLQEKDICSYCLYEHVFMK